MPTSPLPILTHLCCAHKETPPPLAAAPTLQLPPPGGSPTRVDPTWPSVELYSEPFVLSFLPPASCPQLHACGSAHRNLSSWLNSSVATRPSPPFPPAAADERPVTFSLLLCVHVSSLLWEHVLRRGTAAEPLQNVLRDRHQGGPAVPEWMSLTALHPQPSTGSPVIPSHFLWGVTLHLSLGPNRRKMNAQVFFSHFSSI